MNIVEIEKQALILILGMSATNKGDRRRWKL